MSPHYLTIEDRETVGLRLDAMNLHLAEFCFPNLYFFRKTHEYKLIDAQETFFISGITYDQKRYMMPLHSPGDDPECCLEYLVKELEEGRHDIIFPIPEEWLDCFPEDRFHHEYNPNDSDYLYLTEKMVRLSGKKLQKKRNLISQFTREYGEPEIHRISKENRHQALDILDQWQEAYPDEINVSDYCQCREALHDMEGFKLTGAVFMAEGIPAGFVLGEALNKETFTIHFAKGITTFKGIYPLMFSRFCQHFLQDFRYMNMEQDLGKPGLRQTKRSYSPDLMAHKYRISLKKENRIAP